MNNQDNNAELPAPLALSLDELRLVAAGTGYSLATATSILHIYGGILVPQVSLAAVAAVRAV